MQQYHLGQYLRRRYNGFLAEKYHSEEVKHKISINSNAVFRNYCEILFYNIDLNSIDSFVSNSCTWSAQTWIGPLWASNQIWPAYSHPFTNGTPTWIGNPFPCEQSPGKRTRFVQFICSWDKKLIIIHSYPFSTSTSTSNVPNTTNFITTSSKIQTSSKPLMKRTKISCHTYQRNQDSKHQPWRK